MIIIYINYQAIFFMIIYQSLTIK